MSDRPTPKRLRWGLPDTPIPKHPYRDTLLVYGFLALLVVLVGWLTGGSIKRAVAAAVIVWVAASIWSMARFRQRIQREAARRALEEEDLL